jgi:hypothetical protein
VELNCEEEWFGWKLLDFVEWKIMSLAVNVKHAQGQDCWQRERRFGYATPLWHNSGQETHKEEKEKAYHWPNIKDTKWSLMKRKPKDSPQNERENWRSF